MHWSYIAYAIGTICLWQIVIDFFHERRAQPHWVLRCIKPSYALEKLAQGAKAVFKFLGWIAGVISSFYDYIDLEMLYMPLWRMAKPIYRLLTSWFYFFDSYTRFARSFTKGDRIYVGSTLLIIAGWMGALCYLNREVPIFVLFINAIPATAITWGVLYTAYVVAMALHAIGKWLWNSKKSDGLFDTIRKHAEEIIFGPNAQSMATVMNQATDRLNVAAKQLNEATTILESQVETPAS